ncbi:MAG: ribonuclease domain-containing protein [Candidatus Nanopelagicales bacterium]|jgi:ribonuclease T1
MTPIRSVVAALFVLLTAALGGCAADTAVVSPTADVQSVQEGVSGLPTVDVDRLPREAQETYILILDGGPYPYRQDDQVFGNREGLLPQQDYGWYREYTVPTPGSSDRGARRFVVGEDGVFFYTDDHYDSFREVLE